MADLESEGPDERPSASRSEPTAAEYAAAAAVLRRIYMSQSGDFSHVSLTVMYALAEKRHEYLLALLDAGTLQTQTQIALAHVKQLDELLARSRGQAAELSSLADGGLELGRSVAPVLSALGALRAEMADLRADNRRMESSLRDVAAAQANACCSVQ